MIAKPTGRKDPHYLIGLIQLQAITTLHFVPSMLTAFLETDGVDQCTTLKHVICSGEALPVTTQNRFLQLMQADLYNLYGPTEASVDVTYWHCKPTPENQAVPIGYPIANTEIYILDAKNQPVAIGVPGESHIGGIGLAIGL